MKIIDGMSEAFQKGTCIPYTGFSNYVETASRDFVGNNQSREIFISIVNQIIGLISLPFMLIELFFRCLICSFILIGVAIKSAIDKNMKEFTKKSSEFGEQLGNSVLATFMLGFLSSMHVRG